MMGAKRQAAAQMDAMLGMADHTDAAGVGRATRIEAGSV